MRNHFGRTVAVLAVFQLLLAPTTAAALAGSAIKYSGTQRRHAPVISQMGGDALKDLALSFLKQEAEEESGIKSEVAEAANSWAAMSAAVAVSGGATSDFSTNGGYPASPLIKEKIDATKPALDDLLAACVDKAPALVAEPQACLPVARLATWIPREQWQRPLDEWSGPEKAAADDAEACAASLRQHLLEKWDTPAVLHNALEIVGDARSAAVPEAAHRAAYAFSAVLAAAGSGSASVKDALEKELSGEEGVAEAPIVSKAVAKFLTNPREADAKAADGDPLHLLRRAQVAAQGGESWVGDGVCKSSLGARLLGGGKADAPIASTDGLPEGLSEAYGASLISWVCTHAEALSEPSEVATAIDYAIEMRKNQDPSYTLAGRTPKTVAAALEAYALTTCSFTNDEVFEPNPHGVNGLFETNQTIPEGTVVSVPYDEPINGGPGQYELGVGSKDGRGSRPCTVRIAEIGSLRRLIMEGKNLNNCLETRYDSQVKYVLRARQRSSSFWSFTLTYDDIPEEEQEPVYFLLAEVWHLRQGNIIRQAEGPRPRTLPGPEAWYWLDKWCRREGVDLSTWDVYSRVSAPIEKPPVL